MASVNPGPGPSPAASTISDASAVGRVAISGADAEAALFPDAPGQVSTRERSCPSGVPDRVDCLLGLRYAADPSAQVAARELYAKYGILAGLERDHYEEMSWRGKIHIVPEAPLGKYRAHLAWLASAAAEFDALFRALDPDHTIAFRYTWHPFTLRYFRSVDRTTPSAYAAFDEWMIAYNVVGSLNTSEEGVHELYFHELFHRNDGDDGHWSARVLGPIYRAITAKCGTRIACLTPYTPTTTTVRGGTYYAFQPEDYNPVHEYAAELAIRWYREHRAITKKLAKVPAFKCGPKENAESWKLIVDEFFGGVDRVPACAS